MKLEIDFTREYIEKFIKEVLMDVGNRELRLFSFFMTKHNNLKVEYTVGTDKQGCINNPMIHDFISLSEFYEFIDADQDSLIDELTT